MGLPKRKGAKSKRALMNPKKVTHTSLESRIRSVSRDITDRSSDSTPRTSKIPIPFGHKKGSVRVIMQKNIRSSKKKFGSDYRKLQDNHDELVSTSTVREMMTAVTDTMESINLSRDKIGELDSLFDEISRVRLPTRFSGYSLQDDRMQHPTGGGKGYFADPKATAARHYELDLKRKEAVVTAMEDAAKAGATGTEIVHAGIREGIVFTLNEFTAPITAADVKPFSRVSNVPDTQLMEQVEAREQLKIILQKIGGTVEKGPKGMSRPWASRRAQPGNERKRSASPFRR